MYAYYPGSAHNVRVEIKLPFFFFFFAKDSFISKLKKKPNILDYVFFYHKIVHQSKFHTQLLNTYTVHD